MVLNDCATLDPWKNKKTMFESIISMKLLHMINTSHAMLLDHDYFLFFIFIAIPKLDFWWWDFEVWDHSAIIHVVTFRLWIMLLVKKVHEKYAGDRAGNAETRTNGRQNNKINEKMDWTEEPRVMLLRFQSRRWSYFVRPRSHMRKLDNNNPFSQNA